MTHNLPILRDEIKQYLPHRDPMLFLDRVTELGENTIVAESDVRNDADFFKGHFPDMPIMPGVLLVETAAQAGALLVSIVHGLDEGTLIVFSSVESAKFKGAVYPGDKLTIRVAIEKVRLPFYRFSGKIYVGDKLVTSLQFSAAQIKMAEKT